MHISDWRNRFNNQASPWQAEAERRIEQLSRLRARDDELARCRAEAQKPRPAATCPGAAGEPGQPPPWLRTTAWVLVGVGGAA